MADAEAPGSKTPELEIAFDTLAVHAGAEPDELTGAVSPPIYQTSTYAQEGVGRPRNGYEYARSQNPTRERLERAVAALEGAAHGIAFASGSAATAAIAQLASPGDEMVVDNTFASPALQRPITLGADIVFHSATKYLAGHSDTICGIVVTHDDAIAERLRFLQNAMGGVPGPLDCFLVLRGLRTLHLRVERHAANALAVARFLAGRDDVERVIYPGLADGPSAHPHAELASRRMRA